MDTPAHRVHTASRLTAVLRAIADRRTHAFCMVLATTALDPRIRLTGAAGLGR